MEGAALIATLATAVGCGLIAGVFFAFSTFVMGALARRPPHEAVAAMQAINVVVINAWFLGVFFGTAALCVGTTVAAVTNWHRPGSIYLVLGSALYLVGTLGVTVACNVPRNDALARVEPTDPGSAEAWETYRVEWTRWNHVRTAAAAGASAAFCLALVQ